jgi:alkanesulfonate monooxygenase SsuD/methylene tetrahydromethanopterin reductase-like flavin-dependent oxidoreductase (luciferase family)
MGAIYGSPAQVAARLRPWLELGVGTLICHLPDPLTRRQLRRFAAEVMPLVRGGSDAQ